MNNPGSVALEVSLGENDPVGRVHVDLAAYCDFDAWMDQQAQLLIDRWAHLAAPNASRARRSSATELKF